MNNKYGWRECNFLLEFISTLCLLISYILFVVQAFKNIIFVKSNSEEIITERLLYEQFSDEIYSNIKSYPFKQIKFIEEKVSNLDYLNVELKLDTFFDCQGEKNGLLNEFCQDKIISNFTCCKSECCTRQTDSFFCENYNFNLKKATENYKILSYNDEEKNDDPRRKFCKYFSKYRDTTSKILNKYLKIEKFDYNYEELLIKNEENGFVFIGKNHKEGYEDCGELDTLKNHLFLKGISCPINYIYRNGNELYFDSIPSSKLGIFVRIIISEIPPYIHEWKNKYIKQDEATANITIKNINKLTKENINYYQKHNVYFNINEIPNYSREVKEVNEYQKFYWYTTNYIGFKSLKDLIQFKLFFNGTNSKDNPLYKIVISLYPSIPSAIIGLILIILCLAYIVFFILFFKKSSKLKIILFIIKEAIILITFIIGVIIYIVCTKRRFKSININIDEHYNEILNLYNKRRKQIYFLSSIIIISFVFLYEIYFIFFARKNKNNQINLDKKSTIISLKENDKINHNNQNAGVQFYDNKNNLNYDNSSDRKMKNEKSFLKNSARVIQYQNDS